MNPLTSEQLMMIQEAMRRQHGNGYSKDPKVAGLQAKLSIMLELAHSREIRLAGPVPTLTPAKGGAA